MCFFGLLCGTKSALLILISRILTCVSFAVLPARQYSLKRGKDIAYKPSEEKPAEPGMPPVNVVDPEGNAVKTIERADTVYHTPREEFALASVELRIN